MVRSATDVMHDIIVSAVIESIMALKTASKGLPNTLLRDLNAIHANTTFADLPKELQATIGEAVRSAFTQLHKEGYSVSGVRAEATRSPPPRHEGRPPPRGPRPSAGPRKPDRNGPKKPGRDGRGPNKPRGR
jgi:hypothetical protein